MEAPYDVQWQNWPRVEGEALMSEHGFDVQSLSDDELDSLRRAVLSEKAKRKEVGTSPEKIDQAVRQYQVESGVEDGEPWEYPRSPLLRPMEGALRTHDGKLWRSTIDHNVFEPGVSGWKLVPETDPETGETIYPPFSRPSGAHDAYEAGDRITWTDGEVYEAVRDGVDWDPGNAPGDWTLVVEEPPEEEPPGDGEDTDVPPEEEPVEPPEDEEPVEPEPGEGDEEPEPEPDPEPEPEPEPDEPTVPEWEQRYGHNPYNTGDRVTWDGSIYESAIDNNTWTPTEYPQGWTLIS